MSNKESLTPVEKSKLTRIEKKKQDKLHYRVKMERIRQICEIEAKRIEQEHGVKLTYDHFSRTVNTVFLRELQDTKTYLTHDMLTTLREYICKIDRKYTVGFILSQRFNLEDNNDNEEDWTLDVDISDIIELPKPEIEKISK